MEQYSVRKAYHYRLRPTPTQEQALEIVVARCRTLYKVALEQRRTWWGRGQGKSAIYPLSRSDAIHDTLGLRDGPWTWTFHRHVS